MYENIFVVPNIVLCFCKCSWHQAEKAFEKKINAIAALPDAELKKAQDEGDFTRRLVMMEEAKTLPFGAVWEEYCRRSGVPADGAWFDGVRAYERDVLLKRN